MNAALNECNEYFGFVCLYGIGKYFGKFFGNLHEAMKGGVDQKIFHKPKRNMTSSQQESGSNPKADPGLDIRKAT